MDEEQAEPLLPSTRKRHIPKKVLFKTFADTDDDENPASGALESSTDSKKLRDEEKLLQRRRENAGKRVGKYFKKGLSFSHCDAAPYGNKVYLARRKMQDPWYVTVLEVVIIVSVLCFAVYSYYHIDNVIFHIQRVYAHIGHAHSQHQVGQRYMHGIGIGKNHTKAGEYFKMAADRGHAHAKYNLAVGHLKGHHDMLEPGEPRAILEDAALEGVEEAKKVLEKFCNRNKRC